MRGLRGGRVLGGLLMESFCFSQCVGLHICVRCMCVCVFRLCPCMHACMTVSVRCAIVDRNHSSVLYPSSSECLRRFFRSSCLCLMRFHVDAAGGHHQILFPHQGQTGCFEPSCFSTATTRKENKMGKHERERAQEISGHSNPSSHHQCKYLHSM